MQSSRLPLRRTRTASSFSVAHLSPGREPCGQLRARTSPPCVHNLKRVERRPERIDTDMVEERGELFLLPLPCGLPYAAQRLGRASPALRPVSALLIRVPLGPGLGSPGSATGRPALFVGFVTTMPESDFSGSCINGYGSSPSRYGPSDPTGPTADPEISRFPRKGVRTCQGLRPRRVRQALAVA